MSLNNLIIECSMFLSVVKCSEIHKLNMEYICRDPCGMWAHGLHVEIWVLRGISWTLVVSSFKQVVICSDRHFSGTAHSISAVTILFVVAVLLKTGVT